MPVRGALVVERAALDLTGGSSPLCTPNEGPSLLFWVKMRPEGPKPEAQRDDSGGEVSGGVWEAEGSGGVLQTPPAGSGAEPWPLKGLLYS